ncbi:MAG: hypothetical protein GTN78_00405 [Gemmatimonadales bacterium]|nr:hypothetical protein [Gemmatimonadales bacterium]NIQ98653.1 hypothetical protein [Gemmatimonadales bacterium]
MRQILRLVCTCLVVGVNQLYAQGKETPLLDPNMFNFDWDVGADGMVAIALLPLFVLAWFSRPSEEELARKAALEREWHDMLARDTAWSETLTQVALDSAKTSNAYRAIDRLRPLWLRYARVAATHRPRCLGIYVDRSSSAGGEPVLTFVHKSEGNYTEHGFLYWVQNRLRAIEAHGISEIHFSSTLERAIPHWQSLGISGEFVSCPLLEIRRAASAAGSHHSREPGDRGREGEPPELAQPQAG